MLVLLPPSEAKLAPTRGRSLDLGALSFPGLTAARTSLLEALVSLCRGDEADASRILDLPPGLAAEIGRNTRLREAPTAAVGRIYTGVLYDALGLDLLTTSARRRATSRLLVTSSLFGVVRLVDRIPAYRLSGEVSLPGLGTVASVWRRPIEDVLRPVLDQHLVVDLRSGTYAAFWRPGKDLADRVVGVRVLHDVKGRRSVVSHFNKATKGRIVRALLEDGADPQSPAAFVQVLTRLGWAVEPTPGKPHCYDVIVTEL